MRLFWFFVCISQWICHLGATKKIIWKIFMWTSVMSWGSITYSHTILRHIFTFFIQLLGITPQSWFFMYISPRIRRLGEPKKVFWKNYMRTNERSWKSITHSHVILWLIFAITSQLLGITQSWRAQKHFRKKLYEDLHNEQGEHYI